MVLDIQYGCSKLADTSGTVEKEGKTKNAFGASSFSLLVAT